jgi:hypothetical protein
MTDPNELELKSLRAATDELCRLLATGNKTRAEFIEAAGKTLPALAERQAQWESLLATHLEALKACPELERLREEGLLPKFAALATRQRALEEQFAELSSVVVETFTIMREFLDLARGGPEAA